METRYRPHQIEEKWQTRWEADGIYQAWILIEDNHFNETVIPVNLVVDTYLDVAEGPLTTSGIRAWPIRNAPSPFS